MSKIFGIADGRFRDDPEHLRQTLGRMQERLIRRNWQRGITFSEANAGIGHIALTEAPVFQPVRDPSGTMALVFNGYFHFPAGKNSDREVKYYDRQIVAARSFFEEFNRSAHSALRKLNGVFSMAVLDTVNHEVILITDRLGLGLLYYTIAGKGITFASEVKAILENDSYTPGINWKGWSDIFNLGWVAGNDTLFENIYALPPAGILRYNFVTGAHSIETYWSGDEIEIDRNIREEDAIDSCIDYARKAVTKFSDLRKNIMLPLSGGNDSRFLAFSLLNSGIKFTAISTVKDNSDTLDIVNSEKLCRLLNIERTFIDLPEDLYQKYFLTFLEETDFHAPGHVWLCPLVDKLPKDSLVYDGFAGGIVLGHNLHLKSLEELECSTTSEINRNIHSIMRKHYLDEPLDRIFDPGIYLKLKELSLHSFVEDSKPVCQNFHLLTFLLNRSRRGVGVYSINMLHNHALAVLPYMENDYFNYVLSIPNHLRFDYKLYNRIIAELMPGPDIIPTNRMSVDLKAYPMRKRIVDLDSTIDFLFGLLSENALPSGMVNKKEFDEWLKNVKAGKRNPFFRIRPYLYLSIWYNKYFV